MEFSGWLNSGTPDEWKRCHEQKHKHREYDNSYRVMRGTDIIYICDECRIVMHVDGSD